MSAATLMRYADLIPQIEDAIVRHELTTLVCGMGPTAELLPWIDQALVRRLRVWGTHDFCGIYPADDIVLMDDLSNGLRSDGPRYKTILASRPRRFWVFQQFLPLWLDHLPCPVHSVTSGVDFLVHSEQDYGSPSEFYEAPIRLEDSRPHTSLVSPLGATTLAWRERGRRIGVLGVDMIASQHHTGRGLIPEATDKFFTKIATQAKAAGGCIVNLSPISSLRNWKWMHS